MFFFFYFGFIFTPISYCVVAKLIYYWINYSNNGLLLMFSTFKDIVITTLLLLQHIWLIKFYFYSSGQVTSY